MAGMELQNRSPGLKSNHLYDPLQTWRTVEPICSWKTSLQSCAEANVGHLSEGEFPGIRSSFEVHCTNEGVAIAAYWPPLLSFILPDPVPKTPASQWDEAQQGGHRASAIANQIIR